MARTASPATVVAGLALVVFTALLLAAGVAATKRVADLEERHDAAVAAAAAPPDVAQDPAAAFAVLRRSLGRGERFALVFSPPLSDDDEGFYRLLAAADLYPALAVEDRASAHAIVVVGRPDADTLDAFQPVASAGGLWLGRRS